MRQLEAKDLGHGRQSQSVQAAAAWGCLRRQSYSLAAAHLGS
jgi:hypothetical protein